MAQPDRIRVGIVGAGEIVARSHLPVLTNMADVQITWICDRQDERAAAVAGAYGVPFIALPPTPAALPAADVILLGIPYGARWSYYEALAGRGTALVVEKPLFRTLERHERLCAAWPDHALGHGFQRRSLGVVRTCRDLIERGTFGSLRSAHLGLGSPGAVTHGRYFSTPELSGGGVLFETGVHGIDALLYLARASGAQVKRGHMVAEAGMDLHTDAELEIRTQSGATVEGTLQISCLRDTSNQIELVFDRARLHFSLFDGSGRLWLASGGGERDLELSPAKARGYPRTAPQTLYAHWSAFLRGLREGRPNHTAVRDAMLTTAIVEQCYAAAGLHGEPGAP
jgi:predicted dehydrogenase